MLKEQYTLITRTYIWSLANLANELAEKGWRAQGNVIVDTRKTGWFRTETKYSLMMYREVETCEQAKDVDPRQKPEAKTEEITRAFDHAAGQIDETRAMLENARPFTPTPGANHSLFRKELERLINRFSMENGSNTPDFILAGFLSNCIKAFDSAIRKRDNWYGYGKQPFDRNQSL